MRINKRICHMNWYLMLDTKIVSCIILFGIIGTKKYYVCIINIKFSNHTCVCKVSIALHFLISVNLPGCVALELWKILRFHLVNSLSSLKIGC